MARSLRESAEYSDGNFGIAKEGDAGFLPADRRQNNQIAAWVEAAASEAPTVVMNSSQRLPSAFPPALLPSANQNTLAIEQGPAGTLACEASELLPALQPHFVQPPSADRRPVVADIRWQVRAAIVASVLTVGSALGGVLYYELFETSPTPVPSEPVLR